MPETYGDAPGWSENQGTNPPGVVPATSPVASEGEPEGAPPTPEPQPEGSSEQGTPQAPPPATPPTEDVPFHQHPRWIERQKEIERLRVERDEAQRLARLAVERIQQPTQAPVQQDDPWQGLVNHPDPATAQFYQQQRTLFQREAERMADQKLQGVLQAVDAGRRELAAIKIGQFRKENPDIKPGSQEEAAIANFVQQGFDLDTARKLALYDMLEAENRALKGKQASVGQKRVAANSEASAGIPAGAGLPPKPGDWRERAGAVLDKGGTMKDVANSIFGGGR
jgi:hypothetical protein